MSIFWMAGKRYFEHLRFWKNVRVPYFKFPQKKNRSENAPLSGSKFSFLAIHIFSHIWEDGSRKVNNDEPDLRCFHGFFWPVISQAVRKPCFSTSIPRGPNLCILCPPTWISRRRRRRRRTNSQIQIQAPPNAPRDEILPRGNPRCWQVWSILFGQAPKRSNRQNTISINTFWFVCLETQVVPVEQ